MKIDIQDNSNDRKYFTIVPNYVLNHSLAIDQALYLQMKRIAGENGKCFTSEKNLCEKLGIGTKALHKSIKYLITHKWIEFTGRTGGKTRPLNTYRIIDLWQENSKFYDNQKIVVESRLSPLNEKDSAQKKTKIVLRSIYKEEPYKEELLIIPKGITKQSFGNQDINFLINYLKEKLGLPLLDGSDKVNRQYCWLGFKKFGGRDKMQLLIDATSQDKFWATKITSFQQLYYKGVQIISNIRGGKYGEYTTK